MPSGNVFSQLRMVVGPFLPGFSTPPTCTGGAGFSGTGTDANPWVGATSCTLPFGSRINVLSFSFYTVTAADFNLAGHKLTDAVNLTWHDLCNDPTNTGNSNCATNPPTVAAASQTVVTQQSPRRRRRDIHNAAHQIVTAVPAGTTVHDFVTVSAPAGSPAADRQRDARLVHEQHLRGQPVLDVGQLPARQRHGRRDRVRQGAARCRALRLPGRTTSGAPPTGRRTVRASRCAWSTRTSRSRRDGVNRVGQNHTFTGARERQRRLRARSTRPTAPRSTSPSTTPPSGSCTTAGGTGSCSITLTSATTGVWAVRASTTVSVGGLDAHALDRRRRAELRARR